MPPPSSPVPGDQRLAAHLVAAERQPEPLQGLAREAVAEHLRPVGDETPVRGLQRHDPHAGATEHIHPGPRSSRAAASWRRQARARRHPRECRWAVRRSNASALASSQPTQRCRSLNVTPAASSRRSQARSSGEVLNGLGNTRPLDPTNVGWPSASHQARKAAAETPRSPAAAAARLRRSGRATAPGPRCA